MQVPTSGDGLSGSFEARSALAVRECQISPDIVRPAYGSYCFSDLPGFFESLLLGATRRMSLPPQLLQSLGRFDHVVFCFFDGFGWRSFERLRETAPFLKSIDERGIVVKTTSQFPSTTAVHVTTETTGKPLFEHGVCGWDYYEPRVGRMIKPLRFSFSEDSQSGTLLQSGLTPQFVLPRPDFLPGLIQAGVEVVRRGPEAYFPSPYNTAFCPLSCIRGYVSLEQGITAAEEVVSACRQRSYQVVYSDAYDVISHKHGVESDETDRVALDILRSYESFLRWKPPGRTLLVVSADHGQITTGHGQKIDIVSRVPHIREYLKKDSRGFPIRFSGGPRNLFLHATEDCIEQLCRELKAALAGAATVLTSAEACSHGLFGVKEIPAALLDRLGTVLVIPHRGYTVEWLEPPSFASSPLSNHGGASPEEMETPLLLLPLE
jgi:hypothetical protein